MEVKPYLLWSEPDDLDDLSKAKALLLSVVILKRYNYTTGCFVYAAKRIVTYDKYSGAPLTEPLVKSGMGYYTCQNIEDLFMAIINPDVFECRWLP